MTTHQLKFLGPAVVTRSISVKEAKAGGFVLAEDLEWSLANRHTLLVDDLDDTAVEYFQGDDEFRVKEIGKGEAAEEPKITAKQQADADAITGSRGSGGGGSSIATPTAGRTSTSTTTATG